MIVVDTSAILNSLGGPRPNTLLRERLVSEPTLHAPHLIDVELIHALRRLVRQDEIAVERAEGVLADFALIRLTRYPHAPLVGRIWQLRHTLTAYDATFIALAEALEAQLVTSDRHLARSSGHSANIELFA